MELKSFNKCRDHPEEYIGGMCSKYNCDKILSCFRCAFTDHAEAHKTKAFTINEFIDEAANMFEEFKKNKLLDEEIPSEYLDFFNDENENIDKLHHHIEKEKKKCR